MKFLIGAQVLGKDGRCAPQAVEFLEKLLAQVGQHPGQVDQALCRREEESVGMAHMVIVVLGVLGTV